MTFAVGACGTSLSFTAASKVVARPLKAVRSPAAKQASHMRAAPTIPSACTGLSSLLLIPRPVQGQAVLGRGVDMHRGRLPRSEKTYDGGFPYPGRGGHAHGR